MDDKLSPWVVGSALAITSAILYTLCAVAFVLWPEAALGFFNAWFHGVDLRVLLPKEKTFSFGIFLYGLAGIMAYAFAAGAIFAVSYNLIKRCPACRPSCPECSRGADTKQ